MQLYGHAVNVEVELGIARLAPMSCSSAFAMKPTLKSTHSSYSQFLCPLCSPLCPRWRHGACFTKDQYKSHYQVHPSFDSSSPSAPLPLYPFASLPFLPPLLPLPPLLLYPLLTPSPPPLFTLSSPCVLAPSLPQPVIFSSPFG